MGSHVGAAATAPRATVGGVLNDSGPTHNAVAFAKNERHPTFERDARTKQGAAGAEAAMRGTKKKKGGSGGGGGGGGGGKSPRSAVLHHGAALARQRLKRQEQIARENERMERRLKVIREANNPNPSFGGPRRSSGPGGVGRCGRPGDADRAGREQRRRRRRPQWDAAVIPGERHRIVDGEQGGGCRPGSGGDAERRRGDAGMSHNDSNTPEGKREAGWRELYHEREALASAVETAAAGVAETRAEVEALRAKALCTEANARRCVAS